MRNRPIANQDGQSLVQVLVSVAIMGILMMAMISVQTMQSKENRSLAEKLAVTEFQKTMIAAMADGAVCKYLMKQLGSNGHFNATAVSSNNPQVIVVATASGSGPNFPLYGSVTEPGDVLGPVIAKVGEAPSAFSSFVVVNSIRLSIDGAPSGPITNPATFKGNWLVSFDSSKLVRPLKPAAVSTILTVDTTNPAAAKITSCQGLGTGSGVNINACHIVSLTNHYPTGCWSSDGVGGYVCDSYVGCDSGEFALSGWAVCDQSLLGSTGATLTGSTPTGWHGGCWARFPTPPPQIGVVPNMSVTAAAVCCKP